MEGVRTTGSVGDGCVESNKVQGRAGRCGEGDPRKGGQLSSGGRSGVGIAKCATRKGIRRPWAGV
jgi:hypothetical protein